MKKKIILGLLLICNLSFSQVVEKDVVESDGVTSNIISTTTGMYDGTKSKEAKKFYDQAYEYGTKQDYKNAEKFYLKSIEKDPEFVEAYDNLGRVYRRTGDLDKATECYLKSIELYPDGVMAHQNLALVYSIEKNYDKAIHEYKEILRVSPGNVEGYYGLANSYMTLGELDEALENSKKAVKIYEETNSHHIGDGYHLTGLIQYYKGDKKEAKKYLKLAKDEGTNIHPQLEEEFFNKN